MNDMSKDKWLREADERIANCREVIQEMQDASSCDRQYWCRIKQEAESARAEIAFLEEGKRLMTRPTVEEMVKEFFRAADEAESNPGRYVRVDPRNVRVRKEDGE